MAGCARPDTHALAAAEDQARGTQVFTWLVEHEPERLVAWNVAPESLRAMLPDVTVYAASSERPCAQAARAHAALVVLLPHGGGAQRDYVLNCGLRLYRDAAAVVVAPLP